MKERKGSGVVDVDDNEVVMALLNNDSAAITDLFAGGEHLLVAQSVESRLKLLKDLNGWPGSVTTLWGLSLETVYAPMAFSG